MSLRLCDAHNHLQDERFGGRQAELLAACAREGVVRMVVNGSCEADWPHVLKLARDFSLSPRRTSEGSLRENGPAFKSQASSRPSPPTELEERESEGVVPWPQILPSFGYHPWYVQERTPEWRQHLIGFLDQIPSAIGEIGLDRWKPDLPYDRQEEIFIAQLRMAAERNLPVSMHCLQAWGRMLEILKTEPKPACGFLLHSYGGPKEMVKPFAELGAYFSLPGFYAHERKERQRETFKTVPRDRLLIETDAPDQCLPDPRNRFPLADSVSGKPLNHPANLGAVYALAAELHGGPVEALAVRVEDNFLRLFGGV